MWVFKCVLCALGNLSICSNQEFSVVAIELSFIAIESFIAINFYSCEIIGNLVQNTNDSTEASELSHNYCTTTYLYLGSVEIFDPLRKRCKLEAYCGSQRIASALRAN